MPDKEKSFSFSFNGLDFNQYSDSDYYLRLVDRYQNTRFDQLWGHGTFDDHQLLRERYSDKATFVSHTSPINYYSLLFANRNNGYLAFTNTIPEKTLNPIDNLPIVKVNSFFEYLSKIHGTIDEGFFYIGDKLCCYAKVTTENVYVYVNNDLVPLLFFCEEYNYNSNIDKLDGAIGTALLTSPYFSDITLYVYTEESTQHIDKYYFYSSTSELDPNPVNKIPGEPIFKSIKMNEFDNSITKIKIQDKEIDLIENLNEVFILEDSRFFKGYLAVKYIGDGKLELGFNLPFKQDPLEEIDFELSYYKDDTFSPTQTCNIYFSDNNISSLYETIKIDAQELYLDVPTQYVLRVENRYFFTDAKEIKFVNLSYLTKQLDVNVNYKILTNNQYVYNTDYVTIPSEKGNKPDEYLFSFTNIYSEVEGFNIPVWVYGYTTNEINRVPDSFIVVDQEVKTDFRYTEFSEAEYLIDFTYRGTIDLIAVELKRVNDDYGYFKVSDFSLEKVSEEDKTLSYKLILNKKIFPKPVTETKIPLRILFNYKVRKKNLKESYWPADTLNKVMTVTYVYNRWEITDISIDNQLLGDGVISFKIKDKLLNEYTDKYSDDDRLTLEGYMEFSSNVTKNLEVMDWDIRNKLWSTPINVKSYGDINLQFKGLNAVSNVATLKHDEPIHPLKVTPLIKDVYVNTLCRTTIELKYNDKINAIYVNGSLVSENTIYKIEGVKNGYGYLSPIYNSNRSEVIAIGVDYTPINEDPINIKININGVNDYDYTNWPVLIDFNVPVKPQSDKVKFELILEDFKFGVNSKANVTFSDSLLSDGKMLATVKNASNEIVVAKPNFNPIGTSFETTNLFIDTYLSDQKDYYLDFEIYEYENAAKDNSLPSQLYYLVRIPFKVP